MCIKYNNLTEIDFNSNLNKSDSNNITTHDSILNKNEILCNINANCEDTGPGQYRCECKEGYVGDGQNCKRKIKCISRQKNVFFCLDYNMQLSNKCNVSCFMLIL